MWIAPAARRRGVGAALMRAVLDWAGDAAVSLGVMRGNDAAYALYTRMGFVETGDHRRLPSDPCKDEIRMTMPAATTSAPA